MFCKNCGSRLADNAYVCPHCGVLTNGAPAPAYNPTSQQEASNVLAIVGFVLSFLIPLAGLICSILGLKKSKEMGGKGHGLALAGLIVSIVSMAISLIALIYVYFVYFALLDAILPALY